MRIFEHFIFEEHLIFSILGFLLEKNFICCGIKFEEFKQPQLNNLNFLEK